MSACQQFKQSFLHQCVSDGLSLSETHEIVKAALAGLRSEPPEKAAGLLDSALLMSAAGGGGAGVLLAKAQGLLTGSDENPEEIKNRELVDAMSRAAAQTRLRNRISTRQQQVAPSRPLLR